MCLFFEFAPRTRKSTHRNENTCFSWWFLFHLRHVRRATSFNELLTQFEDRMGDDCGTFGTFYGGASFQKKNTKITRVAANLMFLMPETMQCPRVRRRDVYQDQ